MAKAHLQALESSEQQRRLSRDDLLRSRIVEKEITVDSLGGTVVARSLSVEARRKIRNASGWGTPEFDEELFNKLAVVESIVDPKLTEKDIATFDAQDSGVFEELVMHLSILNMLGRGEEVKKDSPTTESSDSPSDSASDSE